MTPEQQNELNELHRLASSLLERIGMLRAELQDSDPYMPTPEEWAMSPWAKFAATDDNGTLWLYDLQPDADDLHDWGTHDNAIECEYLRNVASPPDFRNTLRHRPKGI